MTVWQMQSFPILDRALDLRPDEKLCYSCHQLESLPLNSPPTCPSLHLHPPRPHTQSWALSSWPRLAPHTLKPTNPHTPHAPASHPARPPLVCPLARRVANPHTGRRRTCPSSRVHPRAVLARRIHLLLGDLRLPADRVGRDAHLRRHHDAAALAAAAPARGGARAVARGDAAGAAAVAAGAARRRRRARQALRRHGCGRVLQQRTWSRQHGWAPVHASTCCCVSRLFWSTRRHATICSPGSHRGAAGAPSRCRRRRPPLVIPGENKPKFPSSGVQEVEGVGPRLSRDTFRASSGGKSAAVLQAHAIGADEHHYSGDWRAAS